MLLAFVLELRDQFLYLVLGQASFQLLQPYSDLLSAQLAARLLACLPLRKQALVGETFLKHDRVDLNVRHVDPVLIFLHEQAVVHLLEGEPGLLLLLVFLLAVSTETLEDLYELFFGEFKS